MSFRESVNTIDGDVDGARCVCPVDLDKDGDVDVLGTAAFDDFIAWWENLDGEGNFGRRQVIIDDLDWANCVITTDIDGDGDLDIFGTSRNDDLVLWWEVDLQ